MGYAFLGLNTKVSKKTTRHRYFEAEVVVYSHVNSFWNDAGVTCTEVMWAHVMYTLSDPSIWKPEMVIPVTCLSLHCNTFSRGKKLPGEWERNAQLVHWVNFKISARIKSVCISFVHVLTPLVDKMEVLHHKFPFGHLVLRTCIPQPYHSEGKSQSLMESASFSYTEISSDSSFKHMFKSNMHIVYPDPSMPRRKLMDSPIGFEENKCYYFEEQRKNFWALFWPQRGKSLLLPPPWRKRK